MPFLLVYKNRLLHARNSLFFDDCALVAKRWRQGMPCLYYLPLTTNLAFS